MVPAQFGTKEPPAETPVQTVIDAVSTAENIDPCRLPPLYEAIDPNALNALFAGRERTNGTVVFHYNGYRITVTSDDTVTMEEITE